jgi:hypothetical protein
MVDQQSASFARTTIVPCAEKNGRNTWTQETELPGASPHDRDARSNQGGVKDLQEILGHSQPDITAGVCMHPIAECVEQTQDAIYAELTARPKLAAVS